MLLVSSEFSVLLALAGLGTIALGLWHLGVPRWFDYRGALALAGPDLGVYRVGPMRYRRRAEDLAGVAWVMSNAASFVLVSIGLLDLAWATGDRTIPLGVGALWIAGWWGLRAAGQLAVGRRRLDLAIVLPFGALAMLHVATAMIGT